jgi:hypothetical protein
LCRFEKKRGRKETKNKTTPIVYPLFIGGVYKKKKKKKKNKSEKTFNEQVGIT